MKRSTRQTGFTLIELLVVVTIIVALLAILLPSLNRAVAVTQAAICLSNQRQCGNVLLAYASDHQRLFPPSADFIDGPQTSWGWRLFVEGYIATPDAMACTMSVNTSGAEVGGNLGQWDASQPPHTGDNFTQHWVFGMRQGETTGSGHLKSFGITRAPSASDAFVLTESLSNGGTVHADFYIADRYHLVYLKHFERANTWFLDGAARATEADYFENQADWGKPLGHASLYGFTTTVRDYD